MAGDRKAAALGGLSAVVEKRTRLERELRETVVDAHRLGVTWREIADELQRDQPDVIREYEPYMAARPATQEPDVQADPKGAAMAGLAMLRVVVLEIRDIDARADPELRAGQAGTPSSS